MSETILRVLRATGVVGAFFLVAACSSDPEPKTEADVGGDIASDTEHESSDTETVEDAVEDAPDEDVTLEDSEGSDSSIEDSADSDDEDAADSSGSDSGDVAVEDADSGNDDAAVDAADAFGDDAADATEDSGADVVDDTGEPARRGTCATDEDCFGEESRCVAVGDGDDPWYTCQSLRPEATSCSGEGFDECCDSSECNVDEHCFTGPFFYCGGPAPIAENSCLSDECGEDVDCGDGRVCVPAGAFLEHVARCAPAECVEDTDCTSRDGGQCLPFFDPCRGRFGGFFCTYDDSECRTDDDCDPLSTEYCAAGEDGVTSCEEFIAPP